MMYAPKKTKHLKSKCMFKIITVIYVSHVWGPNIFMGLLATLTYKKNCPNFHEQLLKVFLKCGLAFNYLGLLERGIQGYGKLTLEKSFRAVPIVWTNSSLDRSVFVWTSTVTIHVFISLACHATERHQCCKQENSHALAPSDGQIVH